MCEDCEYYRGKAEYYKKKFEFERSITDTLNSAVEFYHKELNLQGTTKQTTVKNINPHMRLVK